MPSPRCSCLSNAATAAGCSAGRSIRPNCSAITAGWLAVSCGTTCLTVTSFANTQVNTQFYGFTDKGTRLYSSAWARQVTLGTSQRQLRPEAGSGWRGRTTSMWICLLRRRSRVPAMTGVSSSLRRRGISMRQRARLPQRSAGDLRAGAARTRRRRIANPQGGQVVGGSASIIGARHLDRHRHADHRPRGHQLEHVQHRRRRDDPVRPAERRLDRAQSRDRRARSVAASTARSPRTAASSSSIRTAF